MSNDSGMRGVEHLAWLDGVRGIAATWVLLHHAAILSGVRNVPLLGWGELAVDLFMLLSGFLMAHHQLARSVPGIPQWGAIPDFLVRRFFRIAPLYYVLLAVALLAGPAIWEYRQAIGTVWPGSTTLQQRYTDVSLLNIATHLTFVFGAIPDYSFRTALPDWSIGLEMQFYAAFPFLMATMSLLRPVVGGALMIAICLASQVLAPAFFQAFPMPSFLPLKLHMFIAGMWIAIGRKQERPMALWAAALVLVALPTLGDPKLQFTFRLFMVSAMFYLSDTKASLPGTPRMPLTRIRIWLSSSVSRFLGETSYAVYLLHLLILTPVAGSLAGSSSYLELPQLARLALCVSATAAITYPLAIALHRSVEQPGIQLGRALLHRGARRSPEIAG